MNTHNRLDLQPPRTFAGFRDLHRGETIVVCGCGRSLAGFRHHQAFVTIGVNDVGRLFQPDYLVVVNARHQFSPDRFRHVAESRARAVFSQLNLGIAHPNQVRFRLGERAGTRVTEGDRLPYTRNSPFIAAVLALHMGASRIGLIGVDFTADHFFGETGRHALAREIAQIDAEYAALRAACEREGVELCNLSALSRVTSVPHCPIEAFAPEAVRSRPLEIVSYATSPVAGVPAILARTIAARTPHRARAVWAAHGYGDGVRFEGDIAFESDPAAAMEALGAADAVIVHNGKVDPAHRAVIASKPVVTLAHNYRWNVDTGFVDMGYPGLVVGQYQAVLPEFAGWAPVPNPLPFWEAAYRTIRKPDRITIAYTPYGKHERYPEGHRLYWHAKGYQTTMAVLDRLAKSHGIGLEVIRDRQVSHAEALAMKARAHIVIDECATGSYHRNSLEGLAAGAVVVNGLGQLDGVEAMLLRCALGAQTHPFVPARLEELEETVTRLVESGPDALAVRGGAGRQWLEAHWDFGRQWPAFFEGPLERAFERHAGLRRRPPKAGPSERVPAAPQEAGLAGVSVVIPFGGRDRLRNVGAVLQAVAAAGVGEIVLAESDHAPLAQAEAAAHGARHVFVPLGERFHKARVMNVGAALATRPRLLWLDADLIASAEVLNRALEEMVSRQLDCLVPWTAVHYLGDADSAAVAAGCLAPETCRPINTHHSRNGGRGGAVLLDRAFVQRNGGMPEGFRGWGGEDNAFFHMAAVWGRAAATRRRDQPFYHLYHPLSGGEGQEAAAGTNPTYRQNVMLMHEIRRIGSASRMAEAFPPPAHPPAPWPDPLKLFCEAGAEALCAALVARFGPAILPVTGRSAADAILPAAAAGAPVTPSLIADTVARLSRAGQEAPPRAALAGPPHAAGLRLNLGCFDRPRPGHVNVDFADGPGVDLVDGLRGTWPWADDSVERIEAEDVIEHLPEPIHTMNEIWRVLRPGGLVAITVPTTGGPGAWQDPTHVSFWNRNSFHYYEAGNAYRTRFAARYGIVAAFRIVTEALAETRDGPVLSITLQKVAP